MTCDPVDTNMSSAIIPLQSFFANLIAPKKHTPKSTGKHRVTGRGESLTSEEVIARVEAQMAEKKKEEEKQER